MKIARIVPVDLVYRHILTSTATCTDEKIPLAEILCVGDLQTDNEEELAANMHELEEMDYVLWRVTGEETEFTVLHAFPGDGARYWVFDGECSLKLIACSPTSGCRLPNQCTAAQLALLQQFEDWYSKETISEFGRHYPLNLFYSCFPDASAVTSP